MDSDRDWQHVLFSITGGTSHACASVAAVPSEAARPMREDVPSGIQARLQQMAEAEVWMGLCS